MSSLHNKINKQIWKHPTCFFNFLHSVAFGNSLIFSNRACYFSSGEVRKLRIMRRKQERRSARTACCNNKTTVASKKGAEYEGRAHTTLRMHLSSGKLQQFSCYFVPCCFCFSAPPPFSPNIVVFCSVLGWFLLTIAVTSALESWKKVTIN